VKTDSKWGEAASTSHLYNVNQVLLLYQKLYGLVAKFTNLQLAGPDFEVFVNLLQAALPGKVVRDVLVDSVGYLAGQKLTASLLRSTCRRLAGNTKRLQNMKPVTPWTVQRFPEWVAVQIAAARPKRGDSGMGWLFDFQVLTGTPCPCRIRVWWPVKFCFVAATKLGFTRQRNNPKTGRIVPRRYNHPRELVGMRAMVRIEPELSAVEPGFKVIETTGFLVKYNQSLMDKRDRRTPENACPFDFASSLPCFNCAKGYSECDAGTHAKNYIVKPCLSCDCEEALFDPDIPTDVCLDCFTEREIKAHTLKKD
jgi:hypothetical protein